MLRVSHLSTPLLQLLLAPLGVNVLREGALAISWPPGVLLRAYSPTPGTRLYSDHMMGILQQSHPRITLMIVLFSLSLGKTWFGVQRKLSLPNGKTVKKILPETITTKNPRDTEGHNSEMNELSHI